MVPAVIIWLGTLVIGVLAYYRLFATRRTLTPRPGGALAARWTGGYKSGYKTGRVTSTWGTAQLEMFDWGIRVSGYWLWKLILPTWEVRYQEVRSAQHVRWPIGNQGVLLRTDGSAMPIVFSTTRVPQILVQLAMRGVSVEQEVARLKLIDLRT